MALAIVALMAILVSATLITPIIGTEEDLITMSFDFAYPFLDLVLFSVAVLGLAIFLKGNLGKSWLLITAGILVDATADILFSYTTAQEVYYSGHFIDLLFHFGYLLPLLAFYVHTKEL